VTGALLLALLDDRRALLMARLRVLEEMHAIGEASSLDVELALLLDEMQFLAGLYRRLLVEAEA
jgi:hypothetical protein